ncbi:MarR family transcriptional regulator [Actinoalloteichus hymeniacidonis]|uniref:Phosphopantetheinyl transferase n=1 Tax=Actinoalloteichus hymeniacidonis TaxID=340345 RepID=A0AAC9HTP9_9PSEU|nr:MarR family transcriptional regulator [Actinoalloteichus hymeniacidonis]AOS64325.1 phosphopantetheinyl transferase [Actinoalloteichus hymeniacidonis]MBB5907607.1 phosphopantetheinyl transferase/DNA-binding MarR family transcriptional regulator [Actinoalloteichus hymeniacidonis]
MRIDEERHRLSETIQRHEEALMRGAVRIRSHPLLDSGLTMQQFRVLLCLAVDGGLSGHALADQLGVSLATVTGLIDRLLDRGLVNRVPDLRDRRIRLSSLTPAGITLLDDIAVAGREHRRALLAQLSVDELHALERGARAMRAAADRTPADSTLTRPLNIGSPADLLTDGGSAVPQHGASPHRLPALVAGEIQLWWAARATADPVLQRWLDPQESVRYHRFTQDGTRERYLVGRALVRVLIAAHTGIEPAEVRYTSGGAHHETGTGGVVLDGERELCFSIASAGDWVVVALAEGIPVGVDLEHRQSGRHIGPLIDSVLAPGERAEILRLDPADREDVFLGYWTRKAAVLKALDAGWTVRPEQVVMSGPDAAPSIVEWRAGPLHTGVLPTPDSVQVFVPVAPAGHHVGVVAVTCRSTALLDHSAADLLN